MNESTPETVEKNAERTLWFDGPNLTADAVVVHPKSARILLIKRGDTGQWALPGGFINQDEPAALAAQREAQEETGLVLTNEGYLIYQGAVDDPRNTETAWIETSAYLFTLHTMPEVTGNDDAAAAQWTDIAALPALYGSHQQIIEQALRHLGG